MVLLMLPAHTTEPLPSLGVAIYKFDDTFMSGVRDAISQSAQGIAHIVRIEDSQNQQALQNDQMDAFLSVPVDALIINPVDRTAAGFIIEKAAKTGDGIPVIFCNREPLPEDMSTYGKAYYIGAMAKDSGTMCGEILADYYLSHPEADKNGDGVLQYVMLKGEPGHQDAELRTQYSIEALEAAGIRLQRLAEDTGMWDRGKGKEKMASFYAAHGDAIECVLANNDDMALGAIEALQEVGYFQNGKYMPIVSVDATAPALQALQEGTLLGTVLNDAVYQGQAAVELAVLLARGETPNENNCAYPITDGKYIWIPYQKVTRDRYAEFQ